MSLNRYKVTLHAKAEDIKKPKDPPDTDITVTWNDLPQGGLVALEKLIVELLQKTTEFGEAVIASKGSGSNTPNLVK